MPNKKKQTHKGEIIQRFREGFGYYPKEYDVPEIEATLIIEDLKRGMSIKLSSPREDIKSLIKHSLKIKKEFFK